MTMIVKMNSLGHGQASTIINYPIILAIIIPYKCHINGQINEYNKEGRINIKKDRKMSIKVLTQIKILFIHILVFLPGICLSFLFLKKRAIVLHATSINRILVIILFKYHQIGIMLKTFIIKISNYQMDCPQIIGKYLIWLVLKKFSKKMIGSFRMIKMILSYV